MRPAKLGKVELHMESPEAARYHAPILIVPGLYQSAVCWRGVSSILAHRGWEVYLLPRVSDAAVKGKEAPSPLDWQGAQNQLADACEQLGEKVIVFGSDVGAALALSCAERVSPMAMALFGPTSPDHAGRTFRRSLGMFGRRRFDREQGDLRHAPAAHAERAFQPTDLVPEPEAFLSDALGGAPFKGPAALPPTIVFNSQDDPLVDPDHSATFVDDRMAKAGRASLVGRWWPSIGWEAASEQTHRFLILTLSDRVVEFPEEIIGD